MSSGTREGGLFLWGILVFATVWFCVWFDGVWRLVSVCGFHFCFAFLVCKIGNSGAVVRFIGGLLDIHLRC